MNMKFSAIFFVQHGADKWRLSLFDLTDRFTSAVGVCRSPLVFSMRVICCSSSPGTENTG